MQQELGRSPTFIVGSDLQQDKLDVLVRREQHFCERYSKNKPLCFNAKAYQKTHPKKAAIARELGRKDADATLVSPMLLGIADGVSQIEDFGIDASELPNELLNIIEEQAVASLLPGQETEEYSGPISMMREAYETSTSHGSTTILTATMDNSTRIHGKLHPMIAVCSVGDCEILVLRRTDNGQLAPAFHTEMQRVDGNAQCPLQLARVDETIDPNFSEATMIEVIEKGSAVHCVSAFEGDIVVLGTDGVFDNLFVDEVVAICDEMLYTTCGPGGKFHAIDRSLLGQVAKRIVDMCHEKTIPGANGYLACPIGTGGKVDDTSCVVGEVVEWTDAHGDAWANLKRREWFRNFFTCGGVMPSGEEEIVMDDHGYEYDNGARVRKYPTKANGSFSTYYGSEGGSVFGGSFTSMASGWGKIKEGEGRTSAMYGARPQPGSRAELHSHYNEDEDEESETQCSLM